MHCIPYRCTRDTRGTHRTPLGLMISWWLYQSKTTWIHIFGTYHLYVGDVVVAPSLYSLRILTWQNFSLQWEEQTQKVSGRRVACNLIFWYGTGTIFYLFLREVYPGSTCVAHHTKLYGAAQKKAALINLRVTRTSLSWQLQQPRSCSQ